MGMQLPFVVVLFLILAVVLAVVILAAVAMPHLRLPREDEDGPATALDWQLSSPHRRLPRPRR